MASLRPAMRSFLRGWRDDIDVGWQGVLSGVEPALEQIAEALTLEEAEEIIPGRRGRPATGARGDSHIFRALDGIKPDDVNAVILGQDPYPRASRATGRSFEQGDVSDWVEPLSAVAESLRRIVQLVAHTRTGRQIYLEGDTAWKRVVADSGSGRLSLAAPRPFFDDWQRQGILCVNAGLTLSRFEPSVQRAHFRMWQPVLRAILSSVVRRRRRPIVFLLWGRVAASTFDELGIPQIAAESGTRELVRVVRSVHPGAEGRDGRSEFLLGPNTFELANEQLLAAGGQELRW